MQCLVTAVGGTTEQSVAQVTVLNVENGDLPQDMSFRVLQDLYNQLDHTRRKSEEHLNQKGVLEHS